MELSESESKMYEIIFKDNENKLKDIIIKNKKELINIVNNIPVADIKIIYLLRRNKFVFHKGISISVVIQAIKYYLSKNKHAIILTEESKKIYESIYENKK